MYLHNMSIIKKKIFQKHVVNHYIFEQITFIKYSYVKPLSKNSIIGRTKLFLSLIVSLFQPI